MLRQLLVRQRVLLATAALSCGQWYCRRYGKLCMWLYIFFIYINNTYIYIYIIYIMMNRFKFWDGNWSAKAAKPAPPFSPTERLHGLAAWRLPTSGASRTVAGGSASRKASSGNVWRSTQGRSHPVGTWGCCCNCWIVLDLLVGISHVETKNLCEHLTWIWDRPKLLRMMRLKQHQYFMGS